MGRVVSVAATPYGHTATTVASAVTYEPFGPWLALTYGSGIVETVTRDADYALLTIKDAGNATVQNIAYTYPYYDLPGTYTDRLASTNNLTIYYNTQLLFAVSSHQPGIPHGYSYDSNGNRTASTGPVNYTYSYASNSNRLTSITPQNFFFNRRLYECRREHHRVLARLRAQGVTGLAYNNAGRLAQVSGTAGILGSYAYDAFGNRFSKTTGSGTTLFTSAPDMTLLEETTSGVATDYIYLNGRPLAILAGTTFTYLHDNLMGTPQAGTDSLQNVVWKASYLVFGEPISITGSVIVNLRMPGQYYDSETGLTHNGFRDYVPALGRYLEADPISLSGGFNPYGYAAASPARFADPTGLEGETFLERWSQAYNRTSPIANALGALNDARQYPALAMRAAEIDSLLAQSDALGG